MRKAPKKNSRQAGVKAGEPLSTPFKVASIAVALCSLLFLPFTVLLVGAAIMPFSVLRTSHAVLLLACAIAVPTLSANCSLRGHEAYRRGMTTRGWAWVLIPLVPLMLIVGITVYYKSGY